MIRDMDGWIDRTNERNVFTSASAAVSVFPPLQFLRELDLDKDALQKAIIGTIGDVDSYQLPDAKGYSALVRHLLNTTDDERQERREQILGTTLQDFREFADVIDTVKNNGVLAAVASAEATRAASEEMGADALNSINVF